MFTGKQMNVPFANGKYTLTSGFGWRNLNGNPDYHTGYDLVGQGTSQIVSITDGTVISSTMITDHSNLTWQWGNYVCVLTPSGEKVYYCHMASRAVEVGTTVKKGDPIGIMGNTGYSFGAHLHLEVRDASGQSISPEGLTGIPNILQSGANGSYQTAKGERENYQVNTNELSPYVTTSNYKENFRRSYVCTCTDGKKVIQLGDEVNPDGTEAEHLHISFSFTKVATEAGNSGKLNIWNLSPEKRKVFETEGALIELYAGYGNRFARILSGKIYYASTKMDKADRKTQIEIIDDYNSEMKISRSYEGKVSWLKIIETAASDLGLSLQITETARKLLEEKTITNYSLIDNPMEAIDSAIACIWRNYDEHVRLVRSVQEGVLYITQYGEPVSQTYVEISAKTGMIEIPEKELLSGVKYSDDTPVYLWKVKCFLNTAVTAGAMVYVDSNDLKGFFKVHQIDYSGDSVSGDWVSTLSLLSDVDAAYVTAFNK